MTATDLNELLKEVSAEFPAGHKLGGQDGDPVRDLEARLAGEEEGKDWKFINAEAAALLKQSKDLRVAVILCLGLLKVDALEGFQQGLTLMDGLLRKYWNGLFPALVDGTALRRVNQINNLAIEFSLPPRPTPYKFISYLRETTLFRTQSSGPISFNKLSSILTKPSAASPSGTATSPPPGAPAAIAQLVAEGGAEAIQALERIRTMAGLLNGMAAFIEEQTGGKDLPKFNNLLNQLNAMSELLMPEAKSNAPEKATEEQRDKEKPPADLGMISSPQAVVAALDAICKYYDTHERCSPVPLLLRRAQQLAVTDFWGVIRDLVPGAEQELRKIAGEPKKEKESS